MYHLTRCLVLGHNNCISLVWTYDSSVSWYEFEEAPNGALRHVESTPQPLAFYKWADAPASLSNAADYYFASVSGGKPAGQGGGLGTASTIFGAVGVAGDVTSMSNSTFRLMSGANGTFSPKIYNSGWNGGSPARITTYSLSKVGTGVSTGANVVITYMSYNQIYNGEAQPITYVDAGVGTAGILAAGASYFYGVQIPVVGEFVAVYGALRLTWDVSFYLGTKYGPSKWYGTNDNKWFK